MFQNASRTTSNASRRSDRTLAALGAAAIAASISSVSLALPSSESVFQCSVPAEAAEPSCGCEAPAPEAHPTTFREQIASWTATLRDRLDRFADAWKAAAERERQRQREQAEDQRRLQEFAARWFEPALLCNERECTPAFGRSAFAASAK